MSIQKTRPSDRPYEVWVLGDWTWKVRKFYTKTREKTIADRYGRVFAEVVTPYTSASGDLGDTYYYDILTSGANLVSTDYDE